MPEFVVPMLTTTVLACLQVVAVPASVAVIRRHLECSFDSLKSASVDPSF